MCITVVFKIWSFVFLDLFSSYRKLPLTSRRLINFVRGFRGASQGGGGAYIPGAYNRTKNSVSKQAYIAVLITIY